MIWRTAGEMEEAMENLTMDDMDTYAMISRRIANEDIFSIRYVFYALWHGVHWYNVMGERFLNGWKPRTNDRREAVSDDNQL